MKKIATILSLCFVLFSPTILLGQTLPKSSLTFLSADTSKLIDEVTISDYESGWLPANSALRFEWSENQDTVTMREFSRVADSWVFDQWTEVMIYGDPGLVGFNLIEDDYTSECTIEWSNDFVSQISCADNQGDQETYSVEFLEGCYYVDFNDSVDSYNIGTICIQEEYTQIIQFTPEGENQTLNNYFTTDLYDLSNVLFNKILDISFNLIFLDYEEYYYENGEWILSEDVYLDFHEGEDWDFEYVIDLYNENGELVSSDINFIDVDSEFNILVMDNVGFDGSSYSPYVRYQFNYTTVITSNENELSVPSSIHLSQNYPNPFNPSTQIRYELNQAGVVKLEVFDILGRDVQTLVNEFMPAGSHTVSFDASALPSGLYMYRLSMGNFSQVKTMHLLK